MTRRGSGRSVIPARPRFATACVRRRLPVLWACPPGLRHRRCCLGASAFVCARRSRSNAAAYAGLPSSTHSSVASTCACPDDVFTPVEDASLEDAAGPTRPSDDASPPSCPDASLRSLLAPPGRGSVAVSTRAVSPPPDVRTELNSLVSSDLFTKSCRKVWSMAVPSRTALTALPPPKTRRGVMIVCCIGPTNIGIGKAAKAITQRAVRRFSHLYACHVCVHYPYTPGKKYIWYFIFHDSVCLSVIGCPQRFFNFFALLFSNFRRKKREESHTLRRRPQGEGATRTKWPCTS